MKTPASAATWQRRIRLARVYTTAAARIALAAAVLAGCILGDCAVLAYELGRQTGAAVHQRNDELAALAVRLLAPQEPPTAAPAPEPAPAEPAPQPPTPQPAPVASEPLPLQIRRLAASGASQRSIAAQLQCTRHTVRKALAAAPTA